MNMKNTPQLVHAPLLTPRVPRCLASLVAAGLVIQLAPAGAQTAGGDPGRQPSQEAAQPFQPFQPPVAQPFGDVPPQNPERAQNAERLEQAAREAARERPQVRPTDEPEVGQWHSGEAWFKTPVEAGRESWKPTPPSTGAPFHVWDPQTQTWIIIDRNLVTEHYQALQRGEIPPVADPEKIQRLSPAEHQQLQQQADDQRFTVQQQEPQAEPQAEQSGVQPAPQPAPQQASKPAKPGKPAKEAREGRRQRGDQQAKRQQPGELREVSLDGRIEGFREVGIRDDSGLWQDHTLVRIRLENGSESVVDIGRRMDLENIDLEQGQQIQVRGHEGQVDNKKVVIADQIQSGEQSFNIARDDQRREVFGKITDVSRIDLAQARQDSLLVRLEMEDGSAVVVDFGKDTTLEDLNLQSNSQVRVRGEREFIDGKSILVAKQISVDGESTQLPRPPRAQQPPQRMMHPQHHEQRQQQQQQQQVPSEPYQGLQQGPQ